ncbi:hypothetical protein RchiOBHm_Chr5g0039461 [Rosa chinensis]|uniref:Uncharacterized protein n=1 Tax=Rosa chinensis TaxID=74649 RepID=A0A2P6QC99_ROSCH|nr:hypothetical protein RchiOBHm_Chr5g0039461 [Rosa chinensis]
MTMIRCWMFIHEGGGGSLKQLAFAALHFGLCICVLAIQLPPLLLF